MKDGRTHLAYKAEHAVDLDTGAVMAVTVQAANDGDTKTLWNTITEAAEQLERVREVPSAAEGLSADVLKELILDKGYHSNNVIKELTEWEIRTYISEPDRGRRRWKNKAEVRDLVYANRRRVRGKRGKWLLRLRGELLERPFAHYLDRGGMRRAHLRGRENIWKRLLIQVAGCNLGLIMRQLIGHGTPRALKAARALRHALRGALSRLNRFDRCAFRARWALAIVVGSTRLVLSGTSFKPGRVAFSTGC
jgi:transposase